ncbi:hypothetical protein RRG08_017297 [Elysia crispata]|uniref:Uncharacterized protein n=1 Tax=Elysia crispata TaxID=231223 RepID=A0AAE0YA80_9GAST|nr:hypothetical protein RRG08_017297 [Elysia crispata]
MDSGWHHLFCLEGKCVTCGSPAEYIGSKFQRYIDSPVGWQHWECVSQDGRTRLELVFKSRKLRDLLEEFIEKDIMQLFQGFMFVRHLHKFFWQYSQYSLLRGSLQEDEAIMVMDFAENRKAFYAVEVKSAHFGKAQITMHPTVCFYKVGEVQMRHSMVFLSDDICHDYHAVHHFTLASIEALAKAAPLVQRVYIFSDGCAGQYKGKGTFADLSLYTGKRIQRVFFGSEHGKGEANGETGVINRAVDRAVSSGRLTVRNAEDLHTWCSKELTRTEQPSLRDFFLVPREEIIRDRPQTDVVTIPGTRRIHQAERVSDYIIRTRMLACFCEACRRDSESCPNQAYVGTYTVHKLKSSHSNLDDAFLEDDAVESTPVPEPPQISPANDPKVGDFVSVKYTLGKKQLIYNAVVIEPCQPLEDSELMVSFLKDKAHTLFSLKRRRWSLSSSRLALTTEGGIFF